MSFLNMNDNDFSSDEDDVDYVPAEAVSDDENGDELVNEIQKKEEYNKLKVNKEEAKKIWEEMQLEANSSSVSKSNETTSKAKSPSNLVKKESACNVGSKSGSSMTSATTKPKEQSVNFKNPASSLNIVSGGFENNTLFGLKPKPVKKGGLDLSAIMKGSGPSQAKRRSGGLSNVLSTTNKKPKLTTLEKSKLDWTQFKKDEDIEEELTSFTRSKDGYVERLNFLDRTDQRQFELEKQIRLKKNSKR